MQSSRTFVLTVMPTLVHLPERFMVVFEQQNAVDRGPFTVDPLLDFFCRDDAIAIGKLQFQRDLDGFFRPGDKLIFEAGKPPLIKGHPESGVKNSTPPSLSR